MLDCSDLFFARREKHEKQIIGTEKEEKESKTVEKKRLKTNHEVDGREAADEKDRFAREREKERERKIGLS
jgi:hypothetical protein